MSTWEQNIYESGREARRLCIAKTGCPHGMAWMRERHWWLAGWNDMDIEMGALKEAA